MAAPIEETSPRSKGILDNLFFKLVPLAGSASSLVFAVNVMNPKLFANLFAPRDLAVSNCLWFNAHVGVGLYLYQRKHMALASTPNRVLYSVFGAVVFNFGSVLLWATMKTLLPKCGTLRALVGVASGVVLLFIGKDYLDHVDHRTQSEQ